MKTASWILVFVLGFGSLFSFGQLPKPWGPFKNYLAKSREGQPEAVLVSFAEVCRLNPKAAERHFAQSSRDGFKSVHGLSHALENEDDAVDDYYETAEVWIDGHSTLVEVWGLDLELGMQSRTVYCLKNGQIQSVQEIDWEFFEGESIKGPIPPHWTGYEQRWRRTSPKGYTRVLRRYVNELERPVPEPDEFQSPSPERDSPIGFSWSDLHLPKSFSQPR